MAKAFQCDLCEYLESGEPVSKVTVTGGTKPIPAEDWCVECLTSYQDWRASRKPAKLDPDVIDPPIDSLPPGDIPTQGAYQ